MNADGSKLSKRQGDIKIESFRKQGILPLALLNYVIGAGGGFHREQDSKDLYTYEELIKQVIASIYSFSFFKLFLNINEI